MNKKLLNLRITLIITVFLLSIAGCEKSGENSSDSNSTDLRPTVEMSQTPTPTENVTPTPVEDKYIDLTNDEVDELYRRMHDDYELYVGRTGLVLEYYKYLGLEKLELPVIVCYEEEEAIERFGGEWEYIPGTIYVAADEGIKLEDQNWERGWLTVEEIDYEIQHGKAGGIFLTGDENVESKYTDIYSPDPSNGKVTFEEYFRWLRHSGDYWIFRDENGVATGVAETGDYCFSMVPWKTYADEWD